MAIEQDYLLKQIKAIAKLISQILFKRESYEYELPKDGNYSTLDNLYVELNKLLDLNKINQAEDLLFENVDAKNPIVLIIALNFYARLAEKSEKELKSANFSRVEIEQGFLDVLKLYNIKVDKKTDTKG